MKLWQRIVKYLALFLAALILATVVYGIVAAVRLAAGAVFPEKRQTETVPRTDTLAGVPAKLDISVSGELELRFDNVDGCSVSTEDSGLVWSLENGVFKAESKSGLFELKDYGKTTVTLPDSALTAASIKAGAGRLDIRGLRAEKLELSLGAGEAVISGITVSGSATINGGAGRIGITHAELANAQIDLGIGKFDMTARLSGKNNVDCGIGNVDITLVGSESDYDITAERGLGAVNVPNARDGAAKLHIDGGVGVTNVKTEGYTPFSAAD